MKLGPAIVIFVKAPAPGFVKTRLAAALGAAGAAELARCFILDAARLALAVHPNVVMAYAGDFALLETLPISGVSWTPQPSGDLGERLETVVTQLFAQGSDPILVIGADSPTLPVEYLAEAMDALNSGKIDCVLGPAEDGGFYLLGLRHAPSGLFSSIAWSTPQTYTHIKHNIDGCGLRLHVLPPWYDVDTPDDWGRLVDEVRREASVRERASATAEWVMGIRPHKSASAFRMRKR